MNYRLLKQVLKEGLRGIRMCFFSSRRDKYGSIHPSVIVYQPFMGVKENMFLDKGCVIHEYARILAHKGKFVMKRNCVAATGLTMIAQNHDNNNIGDIPRGRNWGHEIPNDVICDEDVWIGANVTLCPGTHIGRGCVVAAGAVCVRTKEYPPYSVIGGNPAHFIKWRFTLEEQIEHEKKVFLDNERLPEEKLRNNYFNFKIKQK